MNGMIQDDEIIVLCLLLSRYLNGIGRKITLKERLKRAGELSHIDFRNTSVS